MGEKSSLLFKNWVVSLLILCSVFFSLGALKPVFAADKEDTDKNQDDEFVLEEIIVTAERREADLQKVPIDVAVVRPDDMERFNVHQMSQLQKLIPDLSTSEGAQGTGFLMLSIRGVEPKYWNPTAETTVAVSIDGMQLTRSNALEGKFYDLERVEQLKGPQGTLYGRGSTAGALSMVTKKADIGEFGGNIQMEYSSFDRRRISGALNIPVSDKLAFRLAGRSIKAGAKDDVGISVEDMWGIRGSMTWEPNDRQQLVVTADADCTDNRGGFGFQGVYYKAFGDVEIVANPDPKLSEAFRRYASGGTVSTPYKAAWYYTPGVAEDQQNKIDSSGIRIDYDHEFDWAWLTVEYGYRTSETDLSWVNTQTPTLQPLGSVTTHYWWAADTIDPVTGEVTLAGTGDQNGWGTVNWNWTTYTAEQDPITGEDIPVTQLILYPSDPPSAIYTLSHTNASTSSFETRITSKESIADGDKIEWLVGGMWMDDKVTEIAQVAENAYNSVELEEYALFGQASWAPFARLNFTGGYRYTWDTKQFTGFTYGTGYAESSPDNYWGVYIPRPMPKDKWNHYSYDARYDTYKVNISWQVTDNILPYIQYSLGIKSLDVSRDGKDVPPEELDAYEAGIKTRLFNGRVQLNLGGYYYEKKNSNDWYYTYQCRIPNFDDDGVFTGCVTIGDQANSALDRINSSYGVLSAGGAKQHGGNVQLTWAITPNDIFMANARYEHNEYYNYNVADAMREAYEPLWGEGNVHSALLPANNVDRTGEEFGNRPWRGNFTYLRNWYIGLDMLTTTVSGFYEGEGLKQYVARRTAVERSYPGNPDYWTFDASLDYSSTRWMPKGYRWTVRVFGNNIFDNDELASRTWNDGYNAWSYTFPANSGYISGTFLEPRKLGVQLSFNF